jgi:hypothetical protein
MSLHLIFRLLKIWMDLVFSVGGFNCLFNVGLSIFLFLFLFRNGNLETDQRKLCFVAVNDVACFLH